MNKYLAIMTSSEDQDLTRSIEIEDISHKVEIVVRLIKSGKPIHLECAEVLIIENGDTNPPSHSISTQNPPKIIKHWSGNHGDFDDL